MRRKKPKRNRKLNRLIEALSHQEPVQDDQLGLVDLGARDRAEALVALAELGDEEAVEPVLQSLEDPVPAVRQTAVRAAVALDLDRARGPLIRGVVSWPDPYHDARVEALEALQQLNDPALPEQVVAEIASSNGTAVLDRITRSAVVSLASETQDGSPTALVRRLIDMLRQADGNRQNVEILLAWFGEYSVDDLIDGLDDLTLRESSATVLGALRESRAVPGLIACLDDERPEIRLAAAGALAEIRDVRGVEGLIRAVSDEDYEVRRQAQLALDALGTVGVVAGVAAVLNLMERKRAEELPPGDSLWSEK